MTEVWESSEEYTKYRS